MNVKVIPTKNKTNPNGSKDIKWLVDSVDDASNDPNQIARWRSIHTDCMLAAPVGEEDGVWGLDIDPEGFETWAGWTGTRPMDDTFMAESARRGPRPVFSMISGSYDLHNAELAPGISVKISKNIVLLLDGTLDDGRQYKVVNDIPPVYPPDWLAKLVIDKCHREPIDTEGIALPLTVEEEKEALDFFDKHIDGNRFKKHGDEDGRDGQWCGMAMVLSSVHEENLSLANKILHTNSRRFTGENGYDEKSVDSRFKYMRQASLEKMQKGLPVMTMRTGLKWAYEDMPSMPIGTSPKKQEVEDDDWDDDTPIPEPIVDIPKIKNVVPISDERLEEFLHLGNGSLTDWGNGMRLIDRYGHILCYNGSFKWVIWDDKRWKIDPKSSRIRKYAQDTARSIYSEAAKIQDSKMVEAWMKWAHQSLNGTRIAEMLNAAAPHLEVETDKFDDIQHPWYLNVQNGVLDLQNRKLIPHDDAKQLYLTKIADVEYDPNAECKKWDNFMEMIFPDEDVRKFVQKAVGLSITGNADARALFFLYGSQGDNGKSTFIRVISDMLGEYAKKVDIEVVFESNRGGTTPMNEQFYNTRFVSTNELDENFKWSVSKVKNLTGNDKRSVNPKYRDVYEFFPTDTLWIFGNNLPSVGGGGGDDAFWDERMNLITFDKKIPAEIKKPMNEVLADFEAERPGILNWALDGLALYLKEGLKRPERVEQDTNQYRRDNDWFAQFIEEECFIDFDDPECKIKKDTLLSQLNEFLSMSGEKSTTKRDLGNRLKEEYKVEAGGQGRSFYIGIRLADHHYAGGRFIGSK